MGSAIAKVRVIPTLPPPPPSPPSIQRQVESAMPAELGEWDVDDATLKAQDALPDAPEDVEDFRLSDELWWGTKAMRVRRHAARLIAMARMLIKR